MGKKVEIDSEELKKIKDELKGAYELIKMYQQKYGDKDMKSYKTQGGNFENLKSDEDKEGK